MRAGDWFNAAVNAFLGIILGIAIVGLGQLVTTAFWPVAILLPILFFGMLWFDGLLSGLIDKVFPSGIRPASKPVARRRVPLIRLLSLPVGMVVGVVLVVLGFGDRVLALLS